MKKYTLPRGYLSASQISSYLRCGLQYYFRYIENVMSPPSVAMMTGSGCHKGFEIYYEDAMESGGASTLTGAQVAEIAIAELETEAEEKDIPLKGEEKDQTVQEIQIATSTYIEEVAPRVTPVSVEQEIRFELLPGIQILAYIDLVRKKTQADAEIFPGEDDIVICDYKVTKAKKPYAFLKDNLQFMLYATGMGVDDVEIHNLKKTTGRITKSKTRDTDWDKPQHDITSNIRMLRNSFSQESEKNHIKNIARHVAEGITKGTFMPCDPETWCCSENWCGYWSMCRGAK